MSSLPHPVESGDSNNSLLSRRQSGSTPAFVQQEMGETPDICKLHALQYISSRYIRDLNISLRFVEDYFGKLSPAADGLDVILLDADGMLSSIDKFGRISSVD